MGQTIRDLTGADQWFVTEMQYQALFVAPGDEPPPRSVLDDPHLAPYHRGFATRSSDVGVIARDDDGSPVGAAWVRRIEGYGFVDPDTPELGMAVVAERRGEGVGSALLSALLERVPRCSLSVDARNPARRLYERFGFAEVRVDGDHGVVMLRDGRP